MTSKLKVDGGRQVAQGDLKPDVVRASGHPAKVHRILAYGLRLTVRDGRRSAADSCEGCSKSVEGRKVYNELRTESTEAPLSSFQSPLR